MQTLAFPVPQAPGVAETVLVAFGFATMLALLLLYAVVLAGWDAEDRTDARRPEDR